MQHKAGSPHRGDDGELPKIEKDERAVLWYVGVLKVGACLDQEKVASSPFGEW